MIAQVLRLTRWEWFKLRKRWMPWILLVPLVVIPQIWLWSEYSAYRAVDFYGEPNFYVRSSEDGAISFSCADIDDGTAAAKLALIPEKYRQEGVEALSVIRKRELCEEQRAEELKLRIWHSQVFVLPVSLANGLATAQFVGMILIVILGTSLMGSEYGLGTLRNALTRGGIERWQLLASKALLLILLSAVAVAIASIPIVVSSLIAASLIPDGMDLTEPGSWSTVLVMFGKVVYGLLPYVVLALFLTVWTSSTTLGVAIAIGYIFAEGIIISFLGERFDRFGWFQNVLDFLLGPAVAGWLTETGVRATGHEAAFFPLDKVESNIRAFLVILSYIAVLASASLWLFQRRDVAGARGE